MSVNQLSRDVENLLSALQQDKTLKVWSLIITFFGDVVLARGGNISAKTVQQVLGEMGVGAGAVRTALSRLAADGWIERQKLGRESFYELSNEGYELSQQASERIYAAVPGNTTTPIASDIWQIVVARPGSSLENLAGTSAIKLSSSSFLCHLKNGLSTKFKDCLVVKGEIAQMPDWVMQGCMPDTIKQSYADLISRFSEVSSPARLSPLDSLILRCLLIHEWRRLLLRTPEVPYELHIDDWPEYQCRCFVVGLYQTLTKQSEVWLDSFATCISGSLPPPAATFNQRFNTPRKTHGNHQ